MPPASCRPPPSTALTTPARMNAFYVGHRFCEACTRGRRWAVCHEGIPTFAPSIAWPLARTSPPLPSCWRPCPSSVDRGPGQRGRSRLWEAVAPQSRLLVARGVHRGAVSRSCSISRRSAASALHWTLARAGCRCSPQSRIPHRLQLPPPQTRVHPCSSHRQPCERVRGAPGRVACRVACAPRPAARASQRRHLRPSRPVRMQRPSKGASLPQQRWAKEPRPAKSHVLEDLAQQRQHGRDRLAQPGLVPLSTLAPHRHGRTEVSAHPVDGWDAVARVGNELSRACVVYLLAHLLLVARLLRLARISNPILGGREAQQLRVDRPHGQGDGRGNGKARGRAQSVKCYGWVGACGGRSRREGGGAVGQRRRRGEARQSAGESESGERERETERERRWAAYKGQHTSSMNRALP
eukprot:scaffold173554_cov35-Tisochrysis_lutea.AAC.1